MSCSLQTARNVPLFALAVLVASAPAFAQGTGSSTTLSGLVTDSQGGVIPGADVLARNNATAAEFRAVTDTGGRFTIPSLPPGTYTAIVTLTGFKSVRLPDVQVFTATPASVNVVLEVGQLEETVVVTGATEIVQTQSANVSTTLAATQIQRLPVITHTALDAVVSLPGVETVGSNTRGSTINGLPTTSIAITLDGVNVQDKRGNEGFFMYIRPMLDSVEEITVSTSTPGAEASGGGSALVRMETRSGSNRFSGSVYNTWRNQAGTSDGDAIARTRHPGWLWRMNTPYWFNKRDIPRTAAGDYFINDVRLQTPGFRAGGPILADRLFYFFNYEEFRLPESRSRSRYILNAQAQQGLFTYPAADGSGNRTVNLLALASANGQTSTMDPSIAKILTDIRTATATTGGVTPYDQLVDQYDYVPSATQTRKFPTLRLDYNVANSHRVSFSGRYNDFFSQPDFLNSAESAFPGFPNLAGQISGRYMWQTSVRSTFGKHVINEARLGAQDGTGKGIYFGKGVDQSQFNCTGPGCQAAGGRGWSFGFPSLSVSLTGASASTTQSASVAAQMTAEDTMTWLKGTHSISMGVTWTRISSRGWSKYAPYAGLTFGTNPLDTVAYNMLDATSGNFPGGINTTWSSYARNLYGFLTGRVTSMSGTAYLQPDGRYAFNGDYNYGVNANNLGVFASDSWRAKPNLTLNGGLRYQVQLPMTTGVPYTRPRTWQMAYGITGAGTGRIGQGNLYKPGTMTGTNPLIVPYEDGSPAYNTDWNNLAPSIGATWRPNLRNGLAGKILSSDPVFRGGYSISFNQLGVNFFDTTYYDNPGISRSASRSATSGTPSLGFDGWPVLLRDTSRLYPSAYPASPTYPVTPAVNESVRIHYPDWPVTYTHQYSFGFQRELGTSMALDVRYVGNTNVGGWTTWNMNASPQWSMLSGENGFLDEFRKAQANLRANIAAGQGNTFAYTGAPGTSPLPIFQAYFNGTPLSNTASNGNPANYTSANYKNPSWYSSLNMYSPALTTIAGTGTSGLQNGLGLGTGLDVNRQAAGLPANFFMANPAIAQASNGSSLDVSAGNTRYNAMQVELRRRMSGGLLIQGSYTHAFGRQTWSWRSLREDWHYVDSTGSPDQSFKLNWVFELPFGQGRKWGGGAGQVLNAFIGGWEWDGVGRVQSGQKFNFGGYRLVGMSDKDLQAMFKFYRVTDSTGVERIYMLPQDVIENSIIALYTTSPTSPTGYAGALPTGRYLAPASGPDCVQYLAGMCPGTSEARVITGPKYWKADMSVVKRFQLPRRMVIEARMELFNVFDAVNFIPVGPTSATPGASGLAAGMGPSVANWQVTSAQTDSSASQDPGGRVTQFGLRFTW